MASIVSNPEHLGGKPRVAGTRISIEFLLETLGCGMAIPEIVEAYPTLTEEAVRGAPRVGALGPDRGSLAPPGMSQFNEVPEPIICDAYAEPAHHWVSRWWGEVFGAPKYHDLTAEEVAKVYGVPFELIPLKATPGGTPPPPPKTCVC